MSNNKFNGNNSEINLLKDSIYLLNDTNKIGYNIQTELDEPNNILTKSNKLLESTEYICNESFRVFINISFLGKLWNLIYSEPVYLTDCNINTKEKINYNSIIQLKDENINNDIISKKDNLLCGLGMVDKSGESCESDESDKYLIEIGNKLSEQNEIIELVDDNTDKLSNKLIQSDLKVNKLNYNYRKLQYKI